MAEGDQRRVRAGGQGKTRLAYRLCNELETRGWITGFAAHARNLSVPAAQLSSSRLPVLVVVD
jgi:hypothetical protein